MRKANSQNRFIRLITLPLRALTKARDLYVKSIINCTGSATYGGNAMGIGSGQISALPRSFSATSSSRSDAGAGSDDDLRELIRAASARSSSGHRVEMDLYLQHQMRRRSAATAAAAVVPRSCSVGMGRIDEEGPCEFFGEEELVYPRSRSYAVTKTSVVFR